jgi:type III secretion system YscJ/HrcJ family lipoprotein
MGSDDVDHSPDTPGARSARGGGARRARSGWLGSAGLALLAAGCTVPVAGDLDDTEANRVFVALERANIEPSREPDPAAEGRWRVDVARDDVARATAVLLEEALPRRAPTGVLEALGQGSLVPSETAERALMAGVAGELERSLESIEGVFRARVHLSLPAAPSRDATPPHGTAAVLLEHRGATPPISADAIQRLVAGGVSGLLASDVAVVLVSRAEAPQTSTSTDLAHVGPIAVARASMRLLQGALAFLVALVAALSAATVVLYARLARAQATLDRESA